MATMDSYQKKGQDLRTDMEEGVSDIAKIGDEFKEVKEHLKDMPGGLDPDLEAMIRDVETKGREEALADIAAVKRTVIDTAKAAADTLRGDTAAKITENVTARGKLDSITGKYGRDSISAAKSALDTNSGKGEELIKSLEEAARNTDMSVQNVVDNI